MSFQPYKNKLFDNGLKIGNYYNLKSSPAYTIPKDTRSGWISQDKYANFTSTDFYNTREQYI